MWQQNNTTDLTLSTHLKWINKENSRSEIYKTDDKGEWTDLTAPVCKRCYKSCVATGGNTSNIFKHLSLAHPDLFRELRAWQVSASFINSDLIWTFIYNRSTHMQIWYSKLKRACVTCYNSEVLVTEYIHLHFKQSNITWIWIKQEFCYIHFSINNMKGMFLPRCRPLIWSNRYSKIYI